MEIVTKDQREDKITENDDIKTACIRTNIINIITAAEKALGKKKVRKRSEEWKECITIPLFKKEDKADLEKYRSISLKSSLAKLFTRIIVEKSDIIGH